MLKGDVTGKLECMYDSCRQELNKLLENKKEQNKSWVQGDNGKKYFTVPTLVKVLRNHFGFELTLKPKNLTAGDIVGTNAIECAETAAIGRCLKFFFGVNSDLANDEEIKYSKGITNKLTVIETLEKKRRDNVPTKN